jgi:translation initiation factor 1 (eIF-1/SUI1)
MSDVIPPGLKPVGKDIIPPGLEPIPPGLKLVTAPTEKPNLQTSLSNAANKILGIFGMTTNEDAIREKNRQAESEQRARQEFMKTLDRAMREREETAVPDEFYDKYGQYLPESRRQLAEKTALAKLRSTFMNIPPDQALDLEPLYSQIESGKEFTTTAEDFINRAGEMLDYWGDSGEFLPLREQRGELGYRVWLGDAGKGWEDIEASKIFDQIMQLNEQMDAITAKHKDKDMGWLADSIYEGIQVAGQMFYGASEGSKKAALLAAGFAGAAAIGGLPLEAAPGPGTAAHAGSIVGAAASGFGLGISEGMLNHIFRQEIGDMFLGFLDVQDELGNRPSIGLARAGTAGYGVISTAIEAFGLSHTPGVSEAFNKVLNTGFGKWLKRATTTGPMKSKLLRVIAKYGVNVGAQVLEELTQESTSFAIEEMIKWGENEFRGTQFESDWDQFWPTLATVASKTAQGVGITSLLGSTYTYTADMAQMKQLEDYQKSIQKMPTDELGFRLAELRREGASPEIITATEKELQREQRESNIAEYYAEKERSKPLEAMEKRGAAMDETLKPMEALEARSKAMDEAYKRVQSETVREVIAAETPEERAVAKADIAESIKGIAPEKITPEIEREMLDLQYVNDNGSIVPTAEELGQTPGLVMTGGPPGAGKTELIGFDKNDMVEVNSDIFKELTEITDAEWHTEARKLSESLMAEAKDDYNIMYDSSLTQYSKAEKAIEDTLAKGGDVFITFIDVTAGTSVARSKAREHIAEKKGKKARPVDPSFSADAYNRALPTFIELYKKYKDNPKVKFDLSNNDMDFAYEQKKIIDNGKIVDQVALDKILNIEYDKIETEKGTVYERKEKVTREDLQENIEELYDRARRIADFYGEKQAAASQVEETPTKKAVKPPEELTDEELSREYDELSAEEAEVTEEEIEAEEGPKGRHVSERARLAEGIKNTKTRVRMLTGQKKIGETVDEYTALKGRMKAEEMAARKGASEGKKIGIKKERERKAKLITKARQKKAENDYIRKLAKSIKKKVSTNTDFYYTEAIEALQAGIDPNFRTKKTLRTRQETWQELAMRAEAIETLQDEEADLEAKKAAKRFLNKHPERTEDMPRKQLELLEKTSFSEMTFKELEELEQEVSDLREKGHLKWQLKKNQERRRINEIRNESMEIILKGKEVKPVPKGKLAGKERGPKKLGRAFMAANERPQPRFDALDGGNVDFDGFHYKYFYNNSNRIVVKGTGIADQRLKSGKDKLKLLGLTISDLYKTRDWGGPKFTVSECIGVYLAMQNPNSRSAILAEHGNALGEGLAEKMIDSLTAEEKALGDWFAAEFEDNYDRVRESHIKQANEDMGKVWGTYFPMRHVDQDTSGGMKQELLDEVAEREVLKKAYPGRGFTKARVNIPDKYQTPLDLDSLKIWMDQVQKQEHYIAAGEQISEWQKVISDPDWKAAVRQEHGSDMVNWIQGWVNVVANPNIYQDMGNATGTLNKLVRGSKKFRRTLAMAYLWGKAATVVKQLPSGALYWPYSGVVRHVAASLKFLAHPMEMIRNVNAMDLEMKHRSIDRFQAEMKAAAPQAYNRILAKVGIAGMSMIWLADKVTTTIGWQACYDRAVAAKNRGGLELSHEEAIEYARNVTLRTQPAAHAKDLAEIYRSHEFVNVMLQFTNQLNQTWNIATNTWPKQIRAIFSEESKGRRLSKAKEAFLTPVSLSIVAITMWSVSHRRAPEDPEDIADAFTELGISAIPGIGRAIQSVAEGFDPGSLPIMGPVGDIVNALTGKKSLESRAEKAVKAVSPIIGFPYSALKQYKKTIETGNIAELFGGRPKKRTFIK